MTEQQHSATCPTKGCGFQAGPFRTKEAVDAAMRAHFTRGCSTPSTTPSTGGKKGR